ncbi:tRNA 2-thiouridine(34) synthase MnmA [Candidatus Nomurabacteria bacterium]|nr:tRNA 2-thiouridine(34) synthase MnmA [Candidatus Nomurabacteria bacterium]
MKRKIVYGKKTQTVFVGLSGGVDSAVSAALLKEQGYDVVGVFIKTWHPDFLVCNEEEERHDAMRVAAFLDIPFLTFNFEDVYKKEVADYMIREYKASRTPNPDVMCNKEVKFGAFLKKAVSMGADFVATGHYASIKQELKNYAGGRFRPGGGVKPKNFLNLVYLLKGNDPSKDQSYFLWTLKQEQLKRILFPVGHLNKTEVRKLAKRFNLPVAEKKDSQGICFLGAVDLKEFLKHYIKEKRGKVINEKGEEVGYHDGVVFHTLGERHGFTITKKTSTDRPYYVVGKDVKNNILYVSQSKNYSKKSTDIFLLKNSSCSARQPAQVSFSNNFCLKIENINWVNEVSNESKNYTAQVRYHGEFLSCQIKKIEENKAELIFQKPVLVASGQSCVIYDNDVCLGGGVVI